jgi:outer membrane protein OmpA-like peptidoglycan-associated protein
MSNGNPSLRSKPILALILLGIAFTAGLLLFFGGETDTPQVDLTPTEASMSPEIPAAAPVEPPALPIDLQTDPSEQPSGGIDPQTEATAQPEVVLEMQADLAGQPETFSELQADPAAQPEGEIGPQADPASVDGRLTELQSRMQRLEAELASLREHQQRIDAALASQPEAIHQGSLAPAVSPVPDAERRAVDRAVDRAIDRAGLDEALQRLGALAGERGRFVTFDESELGFQVGQAELSPERAELLRATAEVLRRYEHLLAHIEGHTDNKGGISRNLELSQARAESVKEALTAMGVDAHRIRAEGLGGARPITDNRTIAARERNRRIEIYLIEPQD